MADSLTNAQFRGAYRLWPWYFVIAGLCIVYLPSFYDLMHGAWATEKNAHGPIVLAVALGFFILRMRQLAFAGELHGRSSPVAGSFLLLFGGICYVLGRSQNVLILEVGSLIPVLASGVALTQGVRVCGRMWFAFFFMLFMIPLPASVVDTLTQPMKIGVSYAAEMLMHTVGYPVARSGVIIYIGQYQLLVADACAGLNSLFTLEALGLLYLNLIRHHSVWRNTLLGLLIVPVSFTANTLRVILLSLITYYFGDRAGQGFLHGFSSIVLFLSALLLIIFLDGVLRWAVLRFNPSDQDVVEREAVLPAFRLPPLFWREKMAALGGAGAITWCCVLVLSAVAAVMMHPAAIALPRADSLAQLVPSTFGDWREIPSPYIQASVTLIDPTQRSTDQPYDDVLTRTYADSAGHQIMLALAYAHEQQQDVKIHLPEVCYRAQGFALQHDDAATMRIANRAVPAQRMLASNNGRLEAVSYWIRIGQDYPRGAINMRYRIFSDGLHGRIDDGMLVRASTIISDGSFSAETYTLQERFLNELTAALKPEGKALLVSNKDI